MRVRIRHTTTFRYDTPATGSFNEVRITPRNDERQNLLSFRLHVSPRARTTEYRDHFGTRVFAFNVWEPHDELSVVGESTVVSAPRPPVPDGAGDLARWTTRRSATPTPSGCTRRRWRAAATT